MNEIITYVGLDVHKESIVIALADGIRGRAVRRYGVIDGSLSALDRVIRKLQSRGRRRLAFAYEAGPCGYGIYRHLRAKGFDFLVMFISVRMGTIDGSGYGNALQCPA